MNQMQEEEELLQSVALQNAAVILRARQQIERELRETRDALRDRDDQLTAMFEQAAVGIALAGLDGRFQTTNRRFLDLFGYSADELSRLTFFDLTHPDDLEETRRIVAQLRAGEIECYQVEKR